MTVLSEKALEAFKKGGSFSKYMTEIMNDDSDDTDNLLSYLTQTCAEFKADSEKWLESFEDPSEVKIYRKKANNILNDISRTCRKELGYTIKCTSRKGGYVYAATEVPPVSPKTMYSVADTIVSITPDYTEALSGKDVTLSSLDADISTLIVRHGLEVVAQVCITALKEAEEDINHCKEI
jgi:hypothetical protein